MKPKTIFIMVIYMILVYTTVGVFANNTFVIGGDNTGLLLTGDEEDATDPEGDTNIYENMSWIDSVGSFFGSIVTAFSYVVGFLTFGLVGLYPELPAFMSWLLLLMVLPVWIAVTYWIAPYAIKAIEAIGNWIPFT